MEIGSFIELDIPYTGELYHDERDTARLNTARAGIYYALQILGVSTVYLPHYLCPTVKNFLDRKGISINYYHLNNAFEPLLENPGKNSAVLLSNYFGIFSGERMSMLSARFDNVIIDNSQSFFSIPLEDCYCVYSPRKFFGVPDGCYVIGKDAGHYTSDYEEDYSSQTAAYLFKRHEYGCSAVYAERMLNEKRLDNADIMQMSKLTHTLLGGIDYNGIREKRQANFKIAHDLYKSMNLLDPTSFMTNEEVPMVYPLVCMDDALVDKLKAKKIYTGRWWKDVLSRVKPDSFEAILSTYMLPVPVDQRYGEKEIEYCYKVIRSVLNL